MKTKYTVKYFIKKFSAISNKLWTTGAFYRAETGACCALGHCGRRFGQPKRPAEVAALIELFSPLPFAVVSINDSAYTGFNQKTPRGRILAALRSLSKYPSK